MKRVFNGVHVLMAVGLIVALAACSGSDNSSIKRDRDQAQAAAAAAEAAAAAAEAAAEAAKTQAEADKAAAEAAVAEAEAQAEAARLAQAEAEAARQAAEDALAGHPRPVADLIADLAAANTALVAATNADADADSAHAAATVARMEAQAALGESPEDPAAALAAFEEALAAETAAAAAAVEAQEALATATAAQQAAHDALAATSRPIDDLEAELTAAKAALTAAMTTLAEADTELAEATEMRMAAQEAVVADPEDLAAAIVALNDAMAAEASAMQNQIAATNAVTHAQAAVDVAQAAVATTDTGPAKDELDAQKVAHAREAFKVLAAIKTEEDALDTTDDAHQVRKATDSISAKHSGTAVTFSAGPKDKTVSRFTAADENKAPGIDGWESATLKVKRKLGGDEDAKSFAATAMVYSNIEAPEGKLFALVYGSLKPAVAVATTPRLTVAMAATMTNTRWMKLVKIPPANNYVGASGAGSVAGTFDGVAGTFACTGTECPASADFAKRRSDGSIIPAATGENPYTQPGTWVFTAADKDATVKIADADHLSFGYWLSKNDTGVPQEFRVMYGGSASVSSAVVDLDETVTYEGAAAGKYVTKDDITNTAKPGYFTASAELTADFRAANTGIAAADGHGTLKGSISGFKDGDDTPLGDLKLSLNGVLRYDATDTDNNIPDGLHVRTGMYTPDGATAAVNTNIVKATSSGVSHGDVGRWEAQLFGKEKNTNLPTGVAGAFNATIGAQAVVVGGFGATKVEE